GGHGGGGTGCGGTCGHAAIAAQTAGCPCARSCAAGTGSGGAGCCTTAGRGCSGGLSACGGSARGLLGQADAADQHQAPGQQCEFLRVVGLAWIVSVGREPC